MDFALIETMRWEPGDGFLRLGLHLDRMQASAASLGFDCNRADALAGLEDAVGGSDPLRVRAELARNGSFAVSVASYAPHAPGTVWRVAIASARLDSRDPLLRHKTTRRDLYAAARAEFAPAQADEAILLNGDGLVCEGTITNVFVRQAPEGPLLTPPLTCGLLPGVLRRELLESGAAREAVLTPRDLAEAPALYCGNSLRGLIPAALT
ncbi:MAG: aminotransferase class IV family protein [Oricola sp.]